MFNPSTIHERIANIRFKHTPSWAVGKKKTVKSDIHKALDALEIAVKALERMDDYSLYLDTMPQIEEALKP